MQLRYLSQDRRLQVYFVFLVLFLCSDGTSGLDDPKTEIVTEWFTTDISVTEDNIVTGDEGNDLTLILGITVGVALMLTLIIGGIYCYQKSQGGERYDPLDDESSSLRFSNPLYQTMYDDDPLGSNNVGQEVNDFAQDRSQDPDEDDGYIIDTPNGYYPI